jgi:hypothetical protein
MITYIREIIISLLVLLLLVATKHIQSLDSKIFSLEGNLIQVNTYNEVLNTEIRANEVDYQTNLKEFELKAQQRPKVVTKLQTITIKEKSNECETVMDMLDQYRNAISE